MTAMTAATTTTTTAAPAPAPKKKKAAAKKEEAPAKPQKTHPELTGKKIAFFGKFALWPKHHHAMPPTVAKKFGADVVDTLDDSVDVVVFGEGAGEGKADAKRKAEKLLPLGKLKVLEEGAYRDLVRVDLKGVRFVFAGGFDISPGEAEDGLLKKMAETLGAVVDADVSADVDYVVEGARRGDKKQAKLNAAKKLIAAGADIKIIDERDFLMLVRTDAPAGSVDGAAGFSNFMGQLYTTVDDGKLGRALKMLKAESFKLYTRLDADKLVGVVKSQTGSGDVYAPWVKSDGSFGCCTQHLDECMGLGGVCKHLLVVVVGLVRTENMKADQALTWLKATKKKAPTFDKNGCAETFLQYKGAEAGTVDWRPTETLPEDFMAL